MFLRLLLLVSFVPSLALASDLKLLTFNTDMLPWPIKNTLQAERKQIIPQQLKNTDYDVMFFEEAFTPGFRYQMIKTLHKIYPYSYYLKRKSELWPVFGSGVFVMSRYPFKLLKRIHFNECTGVDCYAQKGSFVIELTLPSGKIVQLAGTHLDSHGVQARLQQFAEIKGMFDSVKKPGVPQVLMGDFNTDFYDPQYSEDLKTLGMSYTPLVGDIQITSGRANDCYKTPKHGNWIDHVWVNNENASASSSMHVVELQFEHDGKVCPSSDHQAVEADIDFR